MGDGAEEYRQALDYLEITRPDLAEKLIIEGINSGSAEGNEEKEGHFRYLLSICHTQRGKYEYAYNEIMKALDIFDEIGFFGSYCDSYVQLGNVFSHRSYRQSILQNKSRQGNFFLQALECLSFPENQPFIRQNNPSTIADSYIKKSELLMKINEPVGAEMYAIRATKLVSELENGNTYLRAMLSLSQASQYKLDFESSMRLATDALEIAEDQNLPVRAMESRIIQGGSLRFMKEWNSAEEALRTAIQEAEDIGDMFSKLRAIRQLIDVMISTEQNSEVLELDSEVSRILDEFGPYWRLNEDVMTTTTVIYQLLAQFYKKLGRSEDEDRVVKKMVNMITEHSNEFGDVDSES